MRSCYHFAFLLFFQSFFACGQVSEKAQLASLNVAFANNQQMPEKTQPETTNIVFRSADGGQTWQDISAGLPADMDMQADVFFANDHELYASAEHGLYRSSTATAAPAWERELFLGDHTPNLCPSRTGLFAFDYRGHFFQKINGMSLWLPVYTNFQGHHVRTIFENPDGTVFVGCDNGIFKSTDQGKTWKHVFENGWVMKIVESNGVLLCTNEQGILRSTDGGEHWEVVLSEGGVGISVERIASGFAAITYNTESETRRIRTSADGGKTWQPIDTDLPPHAAIASIVQVGQYFFCGHPDGIFRSADQGKTWTLILPSIGKKVFNLSVSGKIIYAVPRDGGC